MKKYLYIGCLLMSLLSINYYQYTVIKHKNKVVSTMSNNYKALDAGVKTWKDAYNKEHSRVIEYVNTTRELSNSSDSLDLLLTKTIKESNIRNSNLEKAGIVITELLAKIKTDSTNTVVTINTDTLKCFSVSDTLINSDVCINPITDSLVSIETNCFNTQTILFESVKETIMSRRKFFLRRWLQKKHIVCYVEIVNSNPYIRTKTSKFIKLIE